MSRCECSDPACRHNSTGKAWAEKHGGSACPATAVNQLERIDMDGAAVEFCEECTADALESGVFALVEETEDDPQ